MARRSFCYVLRTALLLLGVNYFDPVYGQTMKCDIPPEGGTCNLPGFASVVFPPGAFEITNAVT